MAERQKKIKKKKWGVPIVAQWLTNPTRNHEVGCRFNPWLAKDPALVKDPALPWAVV